MIFDPNDFMADGMAWVEAGRAAGLDAAKRYKDTGRITNGLIVDCEVHPIILPAVISEFARIFDENHEESTTP